jgi:hypothetical protein
MVRFMENSSNAKIWKYLDLAKFASLLTTRSLFFACPAQFDDPYEGLLPRTHIEAESKMIQGQVDQLLSLREQFTARAIPLERFDDVLDTLANRVRTARRDAALKFGVSCWHESEYESEAMWKLYSASGQGVAIESTIEQLRASLGGREGLQIDRVRYMDFDRDPIEKGHRHYGLFIKRRCFEHEKEVRATVLLPEAGKGIPIECDLDVLVTAVHVSPLVDGFVKDAIESICKGSTRRLDKPVHQSQLFSDPDYQIQIKTK